MEAAGYKREYEESFFAENINDILNQKKNPFNILPEELIVTIFSHLSFQTILTISTVSKMWQRLTNDNFLWSQIFFQYFQRSPSTPSPESSKGQFKEALIEENRIASECPKWIIEAVGGVHAYANLPTITQFVESQLFNEDFGYRLYFFKEIVNSNLINEPIMRVKFDIYDNNKEQPALMIRFMNGDSLRHEFILFEGEGCRFFYRPKFNQFFIDFFSRLIQGEPCGKLIVYPNQDKIYEEPFPNNGLRFSYLV